MNIQTISATGVSGAADMHQVGDQGSGGGGASGVVHAWTTIVSNVFSSLFHVGGQASSAVGGLAGEGANVLIQAVTSWVTDGAVWLLDEVGQVLSSTTGVDLASSWFGARIALMSELAAAVMLPMLCIAVIQAIYHQSAATLLRIFLVNLPAALLLTGVAVELVRVGMAITDAMSSQFLAAGGVDTRQMLAPVAAFLVSSPTGVPGFVLFIGALMVAGCAFVLWLELVVRSAAIAAAAMFLPIVLAALVWPSIGHWARRLADTLAALVFSKLVVAAVISLAAGALSGGLAGPGSAGTRFGDLVVGIALLMLATFSPFVLFRLIPAFEAGAVSHLEGARSRLVPQGVQSGGKSMGRGAHNTAMDLIKKAPELPQVGEAARGTPGGNTSGDGQSGGGKSALGRTWTGKSTPPSTGAVAQESNDLAPIGSTMTPGGATVATGSIGSSGGASAGAAASTGAGAAVAGATKVTDSAVSVATKAAKGSAPSDDGPKEKPPQNG